MDNAIFKANSINSGVLSHYLYKIQSLKFSIKDLIDLNKKSSLMYLVFDELSISELVSLEKKVKSLAYEISHFIGKEREHKELIEVYNCVYNLTTVPRDVWI